MHYLRRAREILREDGLQVLVQSGWTFASSRTRKLLAKKRDKIFRYIKWRQAAPSPYQVISIDPATIEYVLTPRFQKDLSMKRTYIRGGDWDVTVAGNAEELNLAYVLPNEDPFDRRKVFPYEDYMLHQSFVKHFEYDQPWEDTKYYQWALEEGLEKDRTSRFETVESINEWLAYLDQLYEEMKQEGYKSQKELGGAWYHEVLIDIGRDGRLMLDDGRHRLSIAKILGLDTIPARVFVRHEEWQRFRYELLTEGEHIIQRVNGVDINHPDLRGIT